MYEAGLIRPAIYSNFGYDGITQSYAVAVITLIAAGSVFLLDRIRLKITDTSGIILLNILLALGFIFASFKLGLVLGFIIVAIIAIVGNISFPWISIIVNKQISSQYRATTLSTLSFFIKLPYVILAVFAGSLIQEGKIGTFTSGVGIFIIILVVINEVIFRWLDKKAAVSVEDPK